MYTFSIALSKAIINLLHVCQLVVCPAAAPLVGSTAPDFKATAVFDQEFVDCSLSQYKGKYVVLFFYPLVSVVDHVC
jgi:hypothetical protein